MICPGGLFLVDRVLFTKLTQIFEGTNQINRIVSGRGLLTGKSLLF